MNQRIENYVNDLFVGMPGEQYVQDVREELLSNLKERYDDLLAEGKSEEESYLLVISSIGDIQNLFKDSAHYGLVTPVDIEKKRNTRSIFVSLGVALYILSLSAFFLFTQAGRNLFAFNIMILICAVATGFIVYGVNTFKTRYVKSDNSFVESYKERISEQDRISKLKRSISSSIWTLTLVLYLGISFSTGRWAVTWIIFLLASVVQQMVFVMLKDPRDRKKRYVGLLWSGALIVYFMVSFGLNAWSWSWMIFLVTLALQEIIRLAYIWNGSKDA